MADQEWPELAAKYDADQAPTPAVDEAEHDKLAAEVEPWLQVCGSCDYGVAAGCVCPEGDVRPVMLRLWEAYEEAVKRAVTPCTRRHWKLVDPADDEAEDVWP